MVHALKKIFDAMASMIVHMIQVMSLIVILIHLPIVSLAFYVIDHKRNQQSNPNPRVIKKMVIICTTNTDFLVGAHV